MPRILADCFCEHGFQQQTPDPVTLIKHAELARTQIQKYARAMAGEIGLAPDEAVKMGPIKTLERIWEKALGKYDGRVDRICDICRERLLIDSAADVTMLRRLFGPGKASAFNESWSDRGVYPIEFEDYFAKPSSTGFRGINIKLAVDMGKGRYHICELQVVHKEMAATLDTTHLYFEQIRELKGNAKQQNRALTDVEAGVVNTLEGEAIRLHEADAVSLGLIQLEAAPRHANKGLRLVA